MKELEETELMYGRMLVVSEPHLVTRYNEALKGFGLKKTKLKSFRIDMMGFSPEIAEELGDPDYLDPHRINRRFIILTPAQQELPVIHTAFSNTARLMHQFFEGNTKAINALTIKDVIYGEIDDPVLEAKDIEDLLSIEQVEFRIFTGKDLEKQALKLRLLIDRLKKEPDAWRDDDMLNEMVELVKVTGDIRHNTLVPTEVVFRHNTFWSSHFGGVYVFIDRDQITVIGDPAAPGFRRSRPWQVSYIDRNNGGLVFRFLVETGRVELPRGSWIENSDYLKNRAETLITMLAYKSDPDADYDPENRQWMNSWVNSHTGLAEKEGTLPFLLWAEQEYKSWATIDLNQIDARGRFILSRAKPGHPDQWLVNRLISDYVPFDYVSRFIFNKPAFYEDYKSWGDGLRSYVVRTLQDTYLDNKEKLRRSRYGMQS